MEVTVLNNTDLRGITVIREKTVEGVKTQSRRFISYEELVQFLDEREKK